MERYPNTTLRRLRLLAAAGLLACGGSPQAFSADPLSAPGHGSMSAFTSSRTPPPQNADVHAPRSHAGAFSGTGIVYTCDPTIIALSPTICPTLNTAIAALYANAFTNANASIYITLGSPGIYGYSNWNYGGYSYGTYRNALVASASGPSDATAIAGSVPPASPYPGATVGLINSIQRALGLSNPCLGTPGCYDGTITMGSSPQWYFRNGSISSDQWDFYTVAEHETDEVLGTASCALGCGASGTIFPADLFRYHSDGTRSFAAGTNDLCSSGDSTNACFSLDGVNMLQQYNNIDGDGDAGDWLANCSAPHVQDEAICNGTGGVDISPAAELLVLDAVGYTLFAPATSGTVVNVASSTPNGTYSAGDSVLIDVGFSEAVTVAGVPQLTLNSGGTATYTSGSGTNTLTFTYPVGAGQSSNLLDYWGTGSLMLNGGTIQAAGGTPVNLALPIPGMQGSLSFAASIVVEASAILTQAITFGPLADQALGSTPPPLSATASSGLAVTFASNSPSVCTVSGADITLVAVGTCSITASQTGNAGYAPAAPVTQTFAVTFPLSSCTYSLPAAQLSADAAAAAGQLSLSTNDPSCPWTASSDSPWLTATSSGTGSGNVSYTLAANATNGDRTANLTIGNRTFAFTQKFTAQSFADVPPQAYYFDAVNLLAALGVTHGCSATNYCPAENVTRAQMAIFIVRAAMGGDNFTYNPSPHFNDVPTGAFGFKWIQKMFDLGITTGCGGGAFCPSSDVTRAQMAIFIVRMRYGATAPFDSPPTPYFTDVASGAFGFAWIQRMKEDNITAGCGPSTYCPNNPVTRGDMAIFIMRGGYNQLLPASEPVLASISPATIAPGDGGTFTVTGVNTNFVDGTTTIAPMPGIAVGAVSVTSATTLTVQLTASADAALQPLSVLAITGAGFPNEEAALPNGLLIQ